MDTVDVVTRDEDYHLSDNASSQQDAGSDELKSKPNYR